MSSFYEQVPIGTIWGYFPPAAEEPMEYLQIPRSGRPEAGGAAQSTLAPPNTRAGPRRTRFYRTPRPFTGQAPWQARAPNRPHKKTKPCGRRPPQLTSPSKYHKNPSTLFNASWRRAVALLHPGLQKLARNRHTNPRGGMPVLTISFSPAAVSVLAIYITGGLLID